MPRNTFQTLGSKKKEEIVTQKNGRYYAIQKVIRHSPSTSKNDKQSRTRMFKKSTKIPFGSAIRTGKSFVERTKFPSNGEVVGPI